MASYSWFRVHHGMVSDPKWPLIARRSGHKKGTVVAVWAALLDFASQNEERGSIAGFDSEVIDALYDVEDGTTEAIVKAMKAQGLIVENRIVSWKQYEEPEPAGRQWDISLQCWRVLRQQVFERDGYVCQYCGRPVAHPHCDHVFPLSRGGRSTLDNLVTACPACNCSKHDKTPEEWRRSNER